MNYKDIWEVLKEAIAEQKGSISVENLLKVMEMYEKTIDE